jgi:choline dehydrogenase-like flavoprotein
MQVNPAPEVHDCIVIGSGAAGGMAAWNLTRKGVNVLMLDAGEKFDRAKYWSHVKPWEARYRRVRGDSSPRFFVDSEDAPYTFPEGQPFDLMRVWGRGGKTNVWGRVSLRYSDLNLTEPDRDGWEIPWPIRYKDISPYYDKVDQFVGINGGPDDSPWLPGSKYHLPPPRPRCGEQLLWRAANKSGLRFVSGRRAVMTEARNGHPKCHFCGACGKGCDIGAFFNASDYLVDPALDTGRLKIIDNAVVARILVDDRGLASGVQYFDRHTRAERRVYAKRIVLGASCIDSTRILLNSKSTTYPNGIGNSSDVIGRYLCEQIRCHVTGFVPELLGKPTQNDDGIGGEHIYMPRFDRPKQDYLRGFGIQFWDCGAHEDVPYAKRLPGYGVALKKAIKDRYPARVELHPFGETLPRPENRVTVEGAPMDKYGVPIARIEYSIGENERKMAAAMYDTVEEILVSAKAEILPFDRTVLDMNGGAIHEHGTCRMGADPKKSALNAFCQSHEVKNLFVVDGAAFTTATEKNPTLTILANCWRATDYLAEEIRAGRV